ncbi:MAG: MBL fold metallo-hydrolase [Proteobacteria bacterium]|nr:MBL fold metallo-hydrolase [Pseudomonadota bacterium]
MILNPQSRRAVLGAMLAAGLPRAAAAADTPARAPMLVPRLTEEGQSVIYDAYTWQRRELTKRLPIDEPWPREADIAAQFARFGLDKPPVPAALPVPSTILPGLYLVNSVPNLTYLIDAGPEGLILIDPGLESNAEAILKAVDALGFRTGAIRWVVNTHAHFDHSMADAHFQRLGAKVLVGRADAAAVEKGTEVTAKFALPRAVAATYPTAKVDWPVDDGEELRLGDKTLIAIATPGHTPGSTCYLLNLDGRNLLFGGDTILFDYRLGAQVAVTADNVAYLASLK